MISALPYLAMWLLSFPLSWLSDFALRNGRVSRGCVRKVSNTVAHWGPGLALLALCFVGVDRTITVVLIVAAVGLNAGSLCGYQINHIDLSPNFAGTMMSVSEFYIKLYSKKLKYSLQILIYFYLNMVYRSLIA